MQAGGLSVQQKPAGGARPCSISQEACSKSQAPCSKSQELCTISQPLQYFLGFIRNPKKAPLPAQQLSSSLRTGGSGIGGLQLIAPGVDARHALRDTFAWRPFRAGPRYGLTGLQDTAPGWRPARQRSSPGLSLSTTQAQRCALLPSREAPRAPRGRPAQCHMRRREPTALDSG